MSESQQRFSESVTDDLLKGRRNCNFDDPSPATQCLDGGCNGGLLCDPHTGTVRIFFDTDGSAADMFHYYRVSLLLPLPNLLFRVMASRTFTMVS